MKWALFLFLSPLLLISLTQEKRFHSFMGPYKAVLGRMEPCPPELYGKKEHAMYMLRSTRTNRHQMPRYSGRISSPVYVNDSYDARLALASWSNMGGWKENSHVFTFKKFCKTLNVMAPGIWHDLQLSLFGEAPGCPLYPGFYTYDNFTLDLAESQRRVPIKYFLYGRWRGDASMLHKNGEIAACLRAFVDTVPI